MRRDAETVDGDTEHAVRPSDTDPAEPTLEHRILAAAVRCVARWGVRKTTLEDVAREAGCARASIYRTIPGGKDAVMVAAGEQEIERLLVVLATEIDQAATLGDALVAAIVGAARSMASNEALQHLLAHEPGVVLPFLSFDGLDPLLERAVAFGGPRLERFVDPRTAAELAELATRVVMVYGPDVQVDLTDPAQAHRLVATFVLPGVAAPEPPPNVDLSLVDLEPDPVLASRPSTQPQEQIDVIH